MTNEERTQIAELQRQGYGYKKIATITGLPQNTVKSYCSRHPVQKNDFVESDGLCRNCKKPLEQTPHKRQKKFCSAVCRMAWWNNHPELVQRKAYYTVTCAHCGKRFDSYGNAHRRFCSRACYAEYRRKESSYD